MKLTFKYICLVCLLLINAKSIQGQITIGSKNSPSEGMLLQIKEIEPDIDNFAEPFSLENVTCKTGGLALPRIRLLDVDSFEPFITSAQPDELKEHIGLMVYNVNEDNMCMGLYIWDGSKWEFLREADSSYKKVTDSRDNQVYYYKTFDLAGDWMIENLRYSSGGLIGQFPNQDIASSEEYGLLYTWHEATGGDDEANHGKVQGACPKGWHVPSDLEWNYLEKVISDDKYNRFVKGEYLANLWQSQWENSISDRGTHGKSLKSANQVDNQSANGVSRLPKCGGFNALLVGTLNASSTSLDFGTATAFWSSTLDGTKAWSRSLNSTSDGVKRESNNTAMYFSIRCKKN